jgi:hypothetical protein
MMVLTDNITVICETGIVHAERLGQTTLENDGMPGTADLATGILHTVERGAKHHVDEKIPTSTNLAIETLQCLGAPEGQHLPHTEHGRTAIAIITAQYPTPHPTTSPHVPVHTPLHIEFIPIASIEPAL